MMTMLMVLYSHILTLIVSVGPSKLFADFGDKQRRRETFQTLHSIRSDANSNNQIEFKLELEEAFLLCW